MTARLLRSTTIAAALTIAAAALLLLAAGTAPAAPSTKFYDATVDVANSATVSATSATLRLTLTNDGRQTIGSANFTPPTGVHPSEVLMDVNGNTTNRSGWTAGLEGDVITFRSTSNPLTTGDSVHADVKVNVTQTCTNAFFSTEAKQANDFSGSGNGAAIKEALSNLRPLGSFVIDPIETVVAADPDDLHVPQILVFDPSNAAETTTTARVTAKDICGAEYTDYGTSLGHVSTFAAKPDVPARLAGVNLAITWGAGTGIGTATLKPKVVETGDFLDIEDQMTSGTSIGASSNEFDVVEKLCTSLDTTCEWQYGNGKIRAQSAPPPEGDETSVPSLGIGFNGDLDFSCNGSSTPVGDTLVNINPRDYPESVPTITVSLTYAKSLTGSGPASNFAVCLSHDNGQTWDEPLDPCPSSTPVPADAPCILDRKRGQGGDLYLVLYLKSEDPWGGIS